MIVPWDQVGAPLPIWYPAFLLPLDVTPLDDGINWRVDTAFDYESVALHTILTIPVGFVTDFASTPRLLWPVLPPAGRWGKPSVLHDFLYRTNGIATRAQADRVFLEAMTVLGIGWRTRSIMYAGVRVFGASSYKGGL